MPYFEGFEFGEGAVDGFDHCSFPAVVNWVFQGDWQLCGGLVPPVDKLVERERDLNAHEEVHCSDLPLWGGPIAREVPCVSSESSL